MINPRFSAVWSTTKPIAPFSCTPRVQEVHTKAEVVHLTPGLLGLGYYSMSRIGNALRNICLILESLLFGVRPNRLHHSLVKHVYNKYIPKLRSYTFPLSPRLRGIIQLSRIGNVLRNILILESLHFGVIPNRLHHSLLVQDGHHVYKRCIPKLRSYILPLVS